MNPLLTPDLRYLRGILLAAVFLLMAPARPEAAPEISATSPHGISSTTLANGMQVIVVENHSVPLATVQIAVRNGAFTETPELDGLSHLYEHMFFKGNAVIHTEAAYQERERELGASSNATTGDEVVRYFMTVHRKNLYDAAETLRDALRYPLFSRQEFLQELPVVLGEFDRNEASPMFHLWREMGRKMWFKYFSRKNALGDRDVIINATREQMKLIQSRYYVPNNSALIVGGDVIPEEVFEMAQHLFGDWPSSGVDPFEANPVPEHPPLEKTQRIVVVQDVQTATIDIGWHGPSLGKADAATYAADVLSYVLAQPDSKFQRALVDAGLVDGIEFSYGTLAHTGPIDLMAATSPDRVDAAWKAIEGELAKLNDPDYITDEQIETAKNMLEIEEIYAREQTSQFTLTLGFWWSTAGLDYYLNYLDRLRAVSREDIRRYVDTYIAGKPRVEALLIAESALAGLEFGKSAEIIRPVSGTSATALDRPALVNAKSTETFDVDGLEVVLRHSSETDVVVASLLIEGGLPLHGADQAGREAILLSLLDKGSRGFSKEQVARDLARTGATLAGEARHDYSTFSLRTLKRDFANNFAIFSEAFAHPLLDEAEVKLAVERQLNAIAMREADPDELIAVLASRNFYANHPYEAPPDGLRSTVEGVTRADLLRLHEAVTNRNRLKLFVMGNLTREEIEQAVRQGFADLKAAPFEWPRRPHSAEGEPKLLVESRPLPTNYIFGCFDAANFESPDFPALQVATSILSDRLYEEVRSKRNLTYAVASMLSSRWANYGALYVTTAKPNETLEVMLAEVRRIVAEPVSEKELADKIEEMITRDLIGNEATESQVRRLIAYEATGGGWEREATALDLIHAVTPADVQAAAEKYFRNFHFAALGDPAAFDNKLFTSH